MTIVNEAEFLSIWLEGFLYGKICAFKLTCTLAKEVQLFPGPGLYSGIFAMYLLLCPSTESRTTIIHFYAVCLLYVLSTATFASDLVYFIHYVSNNPICKIPFFLSVAQMRVWTLSSQLQIDSQPMLFHITIVQVTASGCCDFLAQCILVRIKNLYLSSVLLTWIYKDLPLLDRVGSGYPCRDHSFILGNRILRSVIIW